MMLSWSVMIFHQWAKVYLATPSTPKSTTPDQLYPLLYKTSAAAEITLCQLHFYGTKSTPF